MRHTTSNLYNLRQLLKYAYIIEHNLVRREHLIKNCETNMRQQLATPLAVGGTNYYDPEAYMKVHKK